MSALFLEYLKRFIGIRYTFGGNNPLTGFDCSGLVCEGLKALGYISHSTDMSAQQLYDLTIRIKREKAPGALCFFGKEASQISHVAVMVNEFQILEAGGGDSTTLTAGEAAKRNAFVRVRPLSYRRDLIAVVDIWGDEKWKKN